MIVWEAVNCPAGIWPFQMYARHCDPPAPQLCFGFRQLVARNVEIDTSHFNVVAGFSPRSSSTRVPGRGLKPATTLLVSISILRATCDGACSLGSGGRTTECRSTAGDRPLTVSAAPTAVCEDPPGHSSRPPSCAALRSPYSIGRSRYAEGRSSYPNASAPYGIADAEFSCDGCHIGIRGLHIQTHNDHL